MPENSHCNVFPLTLYLDHRFIGPNALEVYALETQQLPQKLFLYSSSEELLLASCKYSLPRSHNSCEKVQAE